MTANCHGQRTKDKSEASSAGSPVSSEMLSASNMETEGASTNQQSTSSTQASEVEMTPPRAEKATSITCSPTSVNTTNMNKSIPIAKLLMVIAKYLSPIKKIIKKMVYLTLLLRTQNKNHMSR